jgi:HK97 family phage prohead protease
MALPVDLASRNVAELDELQLRADVAPSSWNDEDQSCEVVWTAGADVLRTDWSSGTKYYERLDMAPGAVDLGRLNSGRAPVLDAHNDYNGTDVVGVVVAGSVKIDQVARTGSARLRFTRAPDAAPVVQRVKEGVLASFSFGYRRNLIEQTAEQRDGVPVWVVRRWEPFEISPVPIPADAGTGTRGAPSTSKHPCEILRRNSEPMKTPEEIAKLEADRKTEADRHAETTRAAVEKATSDELARSTEIRKIVRKAKLDDKVAEDLVAGRKTVDQARAAVLDALAAKDEKVEVDSRVEVGDTDRDKIRAEFAAGILARVGKKDPKRGELARAFEGMRAARIAEFFLKRAGVDTSLMSDQAIALRVMSTSDFAQALANVQGKTLRDAYNEAPRSFEPFVRRVSVNDFKPVSRVAMSGAPSLLRTAEGAPLVDGTLTDSAQGYQLFKYGTVLAVTWETIVNDDLDAVTKQGLMFGASLAGLEGDLVYAVITSNQVMDEDGVAMINSAHANTTTGALGVTAISTARGKIRKQTAPAPNSRALNLEGRLLLVGPDLEIEARKYLADIVPEASANANPLRDILRGVVSDTRLPATKWWLVATPDQIDTIELANLAGVEDLMIDTVTDFRTKSVQTSVMAARAAAAIDFRWICESSGV